MSESLLLYIDQIDQSVADAEINVLESLIQSYDKSIMIITEASDDTDLSAFDIFQEGEKWDKFKEDSKAPVLGNKGESVGKRILMAIPRLIQKLIALIKNLFSKEKSEERQMDKDIRELEKIAKSSDSVHESVVDDSDGEIVQEGLRDELKQLKSEFSPKKKRKAEYAKRREDAAYNLSQYPSDNLVLRHFETAISDADKLYELKIFSKLCDAIQKADLSNVKDIMSDTRDRRKYDDDSDNVDYARLYPHISLIRETLKYHNFEVERFFEGAGNINSTLKNHVMERLFKMINKSDIDTADRRKRYIREHLSEIKDIRDSINRLHDKRRKTITCIDRFAKDLYDIWKVVIDLDSRPAKFAKIDIYWLATDLNRIVHQSFILNKSIADCWNGLMHAMKGDGKAEIADPYDF